MPLESPFDVIVIGTGITGLSTVYHLQQLGVQRLAIAGSSTLAVSGMAAGSLSGGCVENFTRLSQAHGPETAAQLWRFGDRAFDALAEFCEQQALPFTRRRRLRLLVSPHEVKEALQAVSQMERQGIAASILSPGDWPATAGGNDGLWQPRVLGIQDDGPRGACIDTPSLIACLTKATAAVPRLPEVLAIDPRGSRLNLRLAGEATASCELVVCAAHTGSRVLIPEIAAALVTVADQWCAFDLIGPTEDLAGLVYTANNTYEWGVFASPQRLHMGGGRYLRPMAGIEAELATAEARISDHLAKQLAATYRLQARLAATHALLDISPCDELPLIGPLFGDGRILIATGYAGAGLTLGFYGGACVARLVALGADEHLPRFLWPERLRTLSST